MKIAYLICAYKNPQLIKRLIARLSCENCSFFVHIDRKSDLDEFSGIRGPRVFFTGERIPVYWAEFSFVRAIQILMKEALAPPCHYDYLVLLGGSEYPLRSGDYISRFLETNRGTQFINLVTMPNAEAGKPLCRVTTRRFPTTRPVARFTFRVLAKLGLAQRDYRKYLGNLEPCGGNTYWALTSEACQYILDFDEQNPHVARYLENIFSPDEYLIHTILGNSPFKARIRKSLLFEVWSPGAGHPAMINKMHIAFFESQEAVCVKDVHGLGELLFARKFSDDDLSLIDRIDQMILRKDRLLPDAC